MTHCGWLPRTVTDNEETMEQRHGQCTMGPALLTLNADVQSRYKLYPASENEEIQQMPHLQVLCRSNCSIPQRAEIWWSHVFCVLAVRVLDFIWHVWILYADGNS